MSVQSQQTNCGGCGEILEESTGINPEERLPCQKCGSMKRAFHLTVADTIHVKEMLGLKGKRKGEKKPFMEQKSGDDLHRKSGKWNKLLRIIDRDNDAYMEVVTDPQTGDVIHHKKEPLSQHQGHGDAKKVNKKAK